MLLVCQLFTIASSATVYMTTTVTNTSVAALSNYTLSFNRSLNAVGQTITPSPIASNQLITITFASAYVINSGINMQPIPYSINANTQTITLNLTQSINIITITSFTNPLPSQTPLSITLTFFNTTNPTVAIDACSSSLTFQSLAFPTSTLNY